MSLHKFNSPSLALFTGALIFVTFANLMPASARSTAEESALPTIGAIFMQIDGVALKSETPGYEDWLELNSLQWGTGRGISSPGGRGQSKGVKSAPPKREVSDPSISEVVFTRSSDASSITIMRQAFNKKPLSKVKIRILDLRKGKSEILMEYSLYNVFISGFSTSSSAKGTNENISLNFDRIAVEAPKSSKFEYDLAKTESSEAP